MKKLSFETVDLLCGLTILGLWGLFFQFARDISVATSGFLPPLGIVLVLRTVMAELYGPGWKTEKKIRIFGLMVGITIAAIAVSLSWREAVLFAGNEVELWILRIFAPAVFGWMYGRLAMYYTQKGSREIRK